MDVPYVPAIVVLRKPGSSPLDELTPAFILTFHIKVSLLIVRSAMTAPHHSLAK